MRRKKKSGKSQKNPDKIYITGHKKNKTKRVYDNKIKSLFIIVCICVKRKTDGSFGDGVSFKVRKGTHKSVKTIFVVLYICIHT